MVADGVSTAGRGGEGADLAVEAAARYLCAGGDGGEAADWGEAACRASARRASEELLSVGAASALRTAAEFSTTFVVALVTATATATGGAGGADVVLGRVGDSTAFRLAEGVWQELFLPPESDDLHHTATDVLPFSNQGEGGETTVETTSNHLPAGAAIVLLTDGIANPLRDGPTTVATALAELLRAGPGGNLSPLALAAAADFSRRGCQDDRTIVVAWPRPPLA
jgi:serine/threonine protein phosphatase PrpC